MFVRKTLISGCVAFGATLPAAMPTLAQNFVSQQQILLQLKKQPVIVHGQQDGQVVSNGQGRIVKQFRAPQANEQVFVDPNARIVKKRAPQPNDQVVIVDPNLGGGNQGGKVKTFRAPMPEENGRVVLEMRAPEANGGIARKRVPQPEDQQTIVQEMRAPESNDSGKVAVRRAPAPKEKAVEFASNGADAGDPVARGLDVRVGGQSKAIVENVETGTRYAGYGRVDLEILFDYDSDRINPASFRQLTALVDALNDPSLGGGRFVVAGHTDAVGSSSYNLGLSERRANAVFRFLVEYGGISPKRLVTEGYGEDLLKFPDAPESGQNRRVEIINLGGQG